MDKISSIRVPCSNFWMRILCANPNRAPHKVVPKSEKGDLRKECEEGGSTLRLTATFSRCHSLRTFLYYIWSFTPPMQASFNEQSYCKLPTVIPLNFTYQFYIPINWIKPLRLNTRYRKALTINSNDT